MVSRLDILKAMATKLNDLTDPRRTSTDPMTMMLSSVPGMAPVAPFASALAHAIGGKVLENPVGKAATGLGYAAEAGTLGALEHALIPRQALEQRGIHVPSLLNTREGQAGQRALVALMGPGGGNPYQRMRAANEAAASGDEFAVGLTNAALDPTNLLGPAGKAMEATKLARLGSLLELTDQLQNMPLDQLAVLGKKGGGAAKQALIRRVLGTVEETTGKAGSIARTKIPKVGGIRQFGPPEPSAQLPLGDVPPLPTLPLPASATPPLSTAASKLGDRVAADIAGRTKPLPRQEIPAMGAIPLPLSREQKIATVLAGRFPPAATATETAPELAQVLPDLATPRALPQRQAHDLESIIAGRFGPPQGAVTQAEEAAADALLPTGVQPEFGGIADRAALDTLTPREIDTLVDLAYPHENALNNAMAKHTDDAALAGAAWDRVTKNPDLLQRLTSIDEPLARKLALLPEREGAALPDASQADLDQLIAESAALGGDIAAGGGGGGGLGVIPYPGGINGPVARAIERGAIGGTGGLLGGAAVGAATDDEDRLGGALKGAEVGAGVGFGAGAGSVVATPALRQMMGEVRRVAPDLLDGSMFDPSIWHDAATVALREGKANFGGTGVRGLQEANSAFWQQWRRQVVDTFKQLPQDALTRKFVNWGIARDEFGVTDQLLRRWQTRVSKERLTGQFSADNPLVRKLTALGREDILGNLNDTYGLDFGAATTRADKTFGPLGRAVAGAGIGMGAAVKTVNPVSPLFGAVRGVADPFVSPFIRHLNGTQHDAQRFVLADLALEHELPALAQRFVDGLERQGVDVGALRKVGAFFSPDEVRAVAGDQAADDWDILSKALVEGQGDRIAFLAGDFRAKSETGAEKAIGKAAPFSRWSLRYAPVLAEIASRHPVATYQVIRLMQGAAARGKQEKEKNYQWGTIPVSTETALVGGLARARLGGQQGTVRFDPLGALIPYGADAGAGPDLPEDATLYQKVAGQAGRVGLQPNPALQALAYVAGQDYKAPSALSRTAGLEGGANALPPLARKAGLEVPDLPQLPSGRAALDTARQLLAPVTGATTSTNDPVARRYGELVMRQTGKPLNDKSNAKLLLGFGDPDNPLWQQAQIDVALAGLAGNATGLVSPITTQGETTEAGQARVATAGVPYSYDEIQRQKDAGFKLGDYMQQRNDQYKTANPAANMYAVRDTQDGAYELLRQWEASNKDFLFVAPAAYNRARRKLMEQLGLIEPQKTGTK